MHTDHKVSYLEDSVFRGNGTNCECKRRVGSQNSVSLSLSLSIVLSYSSHQINANFSLLLSLWSAYRSQPFLSLLGHSVKCMLLDSVPRMLMVSNFHAQMDMVLYSELSVSVL